MARGDVRIAVTLACEDCKRRNYQTNKSRRNTPGPDRAAQVLPLVRTPHPAQGNALSRATDGQDRGHSERRSAERARRAARAATPGADRTESTPSTPPRCPSGRRRRGRGRARDRRRAGRARRARAGPATDGDAPSRRPSSRRRRRRAPTRRRRRRAERSRGASAAGASARRTRVKAARRRAGGASASPSRGAQRGPVIGFLVSCWAELKRVQWPDRDTLVQATAVTSSSSPSPAAYLGVARRDLQLARRSGSSRQTGN